MAWARHGHGMASVNQARPHCVNQMGKTHSKPLAARRGRGTASARLAMCESAFSMQTGAAEWKHMWLSRPRKTSKEMYTAMKYIES